MEIGERRGVGQRDNIRRPFALGRGIDTPEQARSSRLGLEAAALFCRAFAAVHLLIWQQRRASKKT